MTAHTAGPWTVHPRFRQYVVPVAEQAKGIGASVDDVRDRADYATVIVDSRPGRRIGADESAANLRLIAAAPELLALAEKFAGECSGCNGSGKNDILRGPDMAWDTEPCPDCADIRAVIAKAVQP